MLDEALNSFRKSDWDICYGASGTVGAVGDILAAAGEPEGKITRAGLDWIYERLLRAQSADKVRLDALKDERRPVIGGGLSVLRAVFDLLGIETMHIAQGALRQGAIFDLLDREHPETDLRASTIQSLQQRFGVDTAQARRVAQTALTLFKQLMPDSDPAFQRKLEWAAALHEIGCQISHSDYHVHGAYILDNTDIAGFSVPELHRLGMLVLGQKGRVRKLDTDLEDAVFAQQLLCLRLAVALCHARREPDLEGIDLAFQGSQFALQTRSGWSKAYPQSAHLLREEMLAWQKTAWEVTVDTR